MSLIIASGLDPSGYAGAVADVRAATALGVLPRLLQTASTVQNREQFLALTPTSPEHFLSQWAAVLAQDAGAETVVKVGMLGSEAIAAALSSRLMAMEAKVVVDPVMCSSTGGALADSGARAYYKSALLRRADLFTPNIPEAEALLDRRIESYDAMADAAGELKAMGARAVLLKGGHLAGGSDALVLDFFCSDEQQFFLASLRWPGPLRGTGCTLATAIAAAMVRGYALPEAVVLARTYLAAAMRLGAQRTAAEPAPLPAGAWPAQPADFPALDRSWQTLIRRVFAPGIGSKPLGIYPIVDRASWVERLGALGVSTIQLRIKDLGGEDLSREIARATAWARPRGLRLFVNDHWELALQHGAYGVHLGQEDLDMADVGRLYAAGMRLGISTHSLVEAAQAKTYEPSYVALGPIFATTAKSMRFAPQGIARVQEWRRMFEGPLVAIGGITCEDAPALINAGADGIAVIASIVTANDPERQTRRWLSIMQESPRS